MVRDFARFARRNHIADETLLELVARADLGIVDADLGSGLLKLRLARPNEKLRLARPNEGRSGGYRTIVAYRVGSDVFFLYGFAKNDRENISSDESSDFRSLGDTLMKADPKTIETQLAAGRILEIMEDE